MRHFNTDMNSLSSISSRAVFVVQIRFQLRLQPRPRVPQGHLLLLLSSTRGINQQTAGHANGCTVEAGSDHDVGVLQAMTNGYRVPGEPNANSGIGHVRILHSVFNDNR
jgi:hypothetical protein